MAIGNEHTASTLPATQMKNIATTITKTLLLMLLFLSLPLLVLNNTSATTSTLILIVLMAFSIMIAIISKITIKTIFITVTFPFCMAGYPCSQLAHAFCQKLR